MKKIMFESKRFGLEQAVLDGYKTMTRRVAKLPQDLTPSDVWHPVANQDGKGRIYFKVDCIDFKQRDLYPLYQIGEEVAVAQSYENIFHEAYKVNYFADCYERFRQAQVDDKPGWNNKMYVRSDLMPHRIRITDIKLEQLQDISHDDCRKEGIIPFTWRQWLKQEPNDFREQQYKDWDCWTLPKFREGLEDALAVSDPDEFIADSPQTAFYVIIRTLMGEKVWDNNPWMWVYEFKLVK